MWQFWQYKAYTSFPLLMLSGRLLLIKEASRKNIAQVIEKIVNVFFILTGLRFIYFFVVSGGKEGGSVCKIVGGTKLETPTQLLIKFSNKKLRKSNMLISFLI
jgi:hypothetical protein